jgi:hypothetical protein
MLDVLMHCSREQVIELLDACEIEPPHPLPGVAPQGGSRSGPAEPDPRTPLE